MLHYQSPPEPPPPKSPPPPKPPKSEPPDELPPPHDDPPPHDEPPLVAALVTALATIQGRAPPRKLPPAPPRPPRPPPPPPRRLLRMMNRTTTMMKIRMQQLLNGRPPVVPMPRGAGTGRWGVACG